MEKMPDGGKQFLIQIKSHSLMYDNDGNENSIVIMRPCELFFYVSDRKITFCRYESRAKTSSLNSSLGRV